MGVWMCGDRLRKRPSQLINRTNHQRRIGSIIFFFSLCYTTLTTLTKHYLFEVMDTPEQKRNQLRKLKRKNDVLNNAATYLEDSEQKQTFSALLTQSMEQLKTQKAIVEALDKQEAEDKAEKQRELDAIEAAKTPQQKYDEAQKAYDNYSKIRHGNIHHLRDLEHEVYKAKKKLEPSQKPAGGRLRRKTYRHKNGKKSRARKNSKKYVI